MALTDEETRVLGYIARTWMDSDGDVPGFDVRHLLGSGAREQLASLRAAGLVDLVGDGQNRDEKYALTLDGAKAVVWPEITAAIEAVLAYMKARIDRDMRTGMFSAAELQEQFPDVGFVAVLRALRLFRFPVYAVSGSRVEWHRGDDIEDVLACSTVDEIAALRESQWEASRTQREQFEQIAHHVNAQRAAARRGQPPPRDQQVGNTAFVIQGHDQPVIDALEDLLRRIGLTVVPWEGSIRDAGKGGSPTNREGFEAGIEHATVVVALFTPDHVATVRPGLKVGAPRFQPRPNVILETGWALGRHPKKVVIVEAGMTHSISDLDGTNTVRMPGAMGQDAIVALNKLATRLETAGATVDRTDHRWNDPARCAALFFPEPVHATPAAPQAAEGGEYDGLDDDSLREVLRHALPEKAGFYTFIQLDKVACVPSGTSKRVGINAAEAAGRLEGSTPGGITLKAKFYVPPDPGSL